MVLRGVAWCCVMLRDAAWCCVMLRGAMALVLRSSDIIVCFGVMDEWVW